VTDFVTAGGRELEYRWAGSGPAAAPCLVFLHEGLGSVSLWRDFPDRLASATGLRALVFSRSGYGRSEPATLPRPVRYMHEEALTVLPELLAQLEIGRHLLVGHSDGASIALIHAGGTAAQNLAGLALLAPHVFNEELCVASIRAARSAYETGDLRDRLKRHHADVDNAFWGWNRIWLDPEFRHWNIEEYLAAIRAPVLAIQGHDDEYGTVAQIEAIEAQVPGARTLLLENCRHSPHRDQPERTLAALVDFIREVA
jgi:pimeloyl-ACP methyl ester carboxylesterase